MSPYSLPETTKTRCTVHTDIAHAARKINISHWTTTEGYCSEGMQLEVTSQQDQKSEGKMELATGDRNRINISHDTARLCRQL